MLPSPSELYEVCVFSSLSVNQILIFYPSILSFLVQFYTCSSLQSLIDDRNESVGM